MDQTELKVRKLELLHDDILSQREVLHYAEWGIPSAIISAAIYADFIQFLSFSVVLMVVLISSLLYMYISNIRTRKDAELLMIRREIDTLMKGGD